MNQEETIVAPATPPGKSALAVIRLSGKSAIEVTSQCFRDSPRFENAPCRTIGLFSAQHPRSNRLIDEVTAIKYQSPQSFTGEDMVEVICHGGTLIVRELIDAFVCAGARIATPGEFTRRAILNGKINLMKVEGIRGLIESQSHKALECAQKLYSGSTKGISELREKILEILAYTEAQIEFEEEADTIRNDKQKIIDLVELLKKDLYKGERIDALDNGWRVVIAGPVNAGKSTLFNALLGKERAIVHNEAGTTRDFISERVFISNTEICLVDTAGLRVVDHEIEKEGINRSRIEIERADFIIWVTAADQALEEEESTLLSALKKKNLFCIINKIDLASGKKKREFFDNMSLRVLRTSFKNQQNHDEVMLVIDEIRNRSQTDVETPNLLLNKRHRESGRRICDELLCAEKNWDRQEIVSYHLKNALAVLDEIFGKTGSDEVMNRVFSGFCIGK